MNGCEDPSLSYECDLTAERDALAARLAAAERERDAAIATRMPNEWYERAMTRAQDAIGSLEWERDVLEKDRTHWIEESHRLAEQRGALREAAGRVKCAKCGGQGYLIEWPAGFSVARIDCPDCADLRALLSPAPSTPTR